MKTRNSSSLSIVILALFSFFTLFSVSIHAQATVLAHEPEEVDPNAFHDQVRIGILAYRPKPDIEARWKPLAKYLEQKIPNVQFKIIPYNYTELEQAVDNRTIDFVFTNSSHFVQIAYHTKLSSPFATLINKRMGQPLSQFAGSILVRADNESIKELSDLKHKTIAVPSKKSFGGFKMQAFELYQIGIHLPDDANIIETTMPHDKAIYAVLEGTADAAFIRSGVLEQMEQQAKINRSDFRIINPQNQFNFPFLNSTRLYPEWPFTAMPHVGKTLAGQVTSALLTLPPGGEVAKQMHIHGFVVPEDYEPIRDVLRTLRVYPFNEGFDIRIGDIWHQKMHEIILGSFLILIIFTLFMLNIRTNLKLKQSYSILKDKNESLKIAAVSFETQEAILITDASRRIIKVNKAFSRITGYSFADIVGKTPGILRSNRHDENFYQQLWETLEEKGYWQGEMWDKRKSGEIFPVRQTINAIKDAKGNITHYISTFDDISSLKKSQEEIKKLAFYDPLTSLANRRLLHDHLSLARAHSQRRQEFFGLLFIDLDHFKTLNDTQGHDVGDQVLIEVAKRLTEAVRKIDTVCRNGGDEFIILLEELDKDEQTSAHKAKLVAEKILANLSKPILIQQKQHYISASIGISIYLDHQVSIEEMLVRSDLAMYKAKKSGRNAVQFFDPAMQETLKIQSKLERDMHLAIERNEFELYYQPKVNAQNSIIGYEALIRWHHPDRGLLLPGEFIEAAERGHLIKPIGEWVIHEACLQLAKWQQNPATEALTIAVNISEKQLADEHFNEQVFNIIKNCRCNPSGLQMEITESLLMKNMDETITKIKELKTLGIQFAIDDFGTGYSSLSYLKKLPIDIIKIDYTFVKDLMNSQYDQAIIKSILTLTETFDLQSVAEGVETQAQCDYLIAMGCNKLQGYFFGKPAPLSEVQAKLKNN